MTSALESQGYTVGSKTRYTLNLEDDMIFPDNNTIPVRPPGPDESWVIIAEVTTEPGARPGGHGFIVRDKKGDRFPVVFATPTAAKDVRRYKQGYLICIFDGSTVNFNSRLGFVVKDKSTTLMLPCNLETLRRLSTRLRAQSRAGEFGQSCNTCKTREHLHRCGGCRTRYCSKECQRADWNTDHWEECRPLRTLIRWNRKEWW
ncbi:hypothetical protein C8F01DRAFT_1162754 [Mycena amicta]|nr:hypothetical protein C8F01DRAFT_1162754 [Mycena amicta]